MTEPKPTEALLPCPFCGGQAELHDNDWCNPPEWNVYYSVCSARTPGDMDKALAAATWNRRAAARSTEPTEAEVAIGRALAAQAPFTVPDAQEMHAFAIASALAAARSPAPEWRDIESAPQDGTWVLVFDPHENHEKSVSIACCYTNAWMRTPYAKRLHPTHFMPLPSPPKETT